MRSGTPGFGRMPMFESADGKPLFAQRRVVWPRWRGPRTGNAPLSHLDDMRTCQGNAYADCTAEREAFVRACLEVVNWARDELVAGVVPALLGPRVNSRQDRRSLGRSARLLGRVNREDAEAQHSEGVRFFRSRASFACGGRFCRSELRPRSTACRSTPSAAVSQSMLAYSATWMRPT